MTMRLGRRLLPSTATNVAADASTAPLDLIKQHDRFFCDAMELIPQDLYFPSEPEDNYAKHKPKKAGKKYHKMIMAESYVPSSKELKRGKFAPENQVSNEEKQQQNSEPVEVEEAAPLEPMPNSTNASVESLRERLAQKIQTLREQRHADSNGPKKRKLETDKPTASKKPKTGLKQTNRPKTQASESTASAGEKEEKEVATENGNLGKEEISYGTLTLGEEESKTPATKTRNGQKMRSLKKLLQKAEKNQEKLQKLNETEEGKAKVQQVQWDKALRQATGETVKDDPKLISKQIKKKVKAKEKSRKKWAERLQQKDSKDKGGKDKDKGGRSKKGTRAGFEGKKGEQFLNKKK